MMNSLNFRRYVVLAAAAILYHSNFAYCQTKPLSERSEETGLLLRDQVTRMLIQESSGDRAHDYVKQLAMWDRSGEHYRDAAKWVETKAKDFGLQQVKIEMFPTENTWIVKRGVLRATYPYAFNITSFDDLPMSVAINSGSIDTTAQLVDVGGGSREEDYTNKDVKGKIVLATENPSAVARIAIDKKGAIGVVSSYSVPYWDATNRLPGDFPDQVGWTGIRANNAKAFAFAISDRKRGELKSVIERKDSVLLHVSLETTKEPDSLRVVTGIIPGERFPNEEIIVTAHLDHYKPGANDNASGSAVVLEMIRTLNYLIETKQIARPLRTIRFLWIPEFSGSTAWVNRHLPDASKKRILNLNLDMLGANLQEVNSEFSIDYTPGANAHFVNALSESILEFINKYNNTRYPKRKDYQIISVNGTHNPAKATMKKNSRGSDSQVFNDYGIAGIGFLTWPDDNYHSSQDRPEYVDPTQLHRVCFGGLAMITTVAYADDSNLNALLGLTYMYGQRRLADDEKNAITLASRATTNSQSGYLSRAIVSAGFNRERKALETCQQLTQGNVSVLIKKYVVALDQKEQLLLKTLKTLAPLATSSDELEVGEFKKYATKVPQRVKGKELMNYYEVREGMMKNNAAAITALEKEVTTMMTILRERETDELRIYDFYNAMACYADGKRNLIEIRNAIYAEYESLFTLSSLETLFKSFENGGGMIFRKDVAK
ncbi:DUF4910 domain-containing protein [Pseudochryseolinea flava]|uniref:Peptidase M28 domain-containing protein n=1 Tax=Pseudochryseolinea flava TaxID=2059302 RepID=A0A364Y132_9BACT|nr:DUF4910 domain-containing protein [Pseudochryseolinea flava]RAW00385.1 hypothetical protein DQQ10_15140 [Pseudochryseolinea flava]